VPADERETSIGTTSVDNSADRFLPRNGFFAVSVDVLLPPLYLARETMNQPSRHSARSSEASHNLQQYILNQRTCRLANGGSCVPMVPVAKSWTVKRVVVAEYLRTIHGLVVV